MRRLYSTQAINVQGGERCSLYDALGRPLRVTQPDETWTEHHYMWWNDAQLGPVWYDDVLDANRHRIQYRYDSLGRLVKVQELEGNCAASGYWGYPCGGAYTTPWTEYANTVYGYDVSDNLTQVTDAAGNVSTMSYDMLGRKTAMHDPDMGEWSYEYDAIGNLTSQLDAQGQSIQFAYDALNRLTLKDLPSGTDVHYYYDEAGYGWSAGRRTRMTDPSGSTAWTYDQRGRVTQEEKVIAGSGEEPFVTGWSYDAMDRVVTMSYPDGEVLTMTFNAQALPTTLNNNSSYAYVDGASYTALGQPALLTFGGASLELQTRYDYDSSDNRLQRLRVGIPSDVGRDLDLTYTYDGVGNVTQIADVRNSQTQNQIFSYDALDRLTHAYTSGSQEIDPYDETYTYNAIGNLMTKGSVTYTYPDPGPNSVRPHAVTSTTAGGSFGYDANGNMTGRRLQTGGPTYSQAWDTENRLASVSGGGQPTTTFTYDGEGTLVKKVANGQTTVYVGNYYEAQIGLTSQLVYSQDFSTSHGWEYPTIFLQPDGGVARFTSTIYGGEAYAAQSGGYFTVPEGAPVRIRLTRDFPSGDMSILMYEAVCLRWRECMGQPAFAFDVPPGSGPVDVVRTDLGGKTIGTLELGRSSGGGSTAEASYLEIYLETPVVEASTNYYYFNGRRIAMRQDGVLYYIAGDHLGTTSVTLKVENDQVTAVAESRHLPYGAIRWESGTLPTDYRFTGQKLDSYIKLYFMGARQMDPYLNRWVQPDTIIPDPANPQSFNRYSYCLGNPLCVA